MAGRDTPLMPAFENRMHRDQPTGFKDPDLVGQAVHLDNASRGVRPAVEIAATLTIASCETRRSGFSTAQNGTSGGSRRSLRQTPG